MTDQEKRDALQTIIHESERLRALARSAGEGLLALQLEHVTDDAKTALIGYPKQPFPPNVVPITR